MEEPVRVFLLYDSTILANSVPDWVAAGFRDLHEETGLVNHEFGNTQGNSVCQALNGASSGGCEQAGTGNQYSILSGKFCNDVTGHTDCHICLGGNGCTPEEDARHDCAMYMAFVGPQDWEEYQPGSAGASARYFDGDSDYVMLPRMNGRNKQPKRSFAEMTIDVWVKVFDFASPHTVMTEDHWDTGDITLQFWPCDGNGGSYCSGQQGMLIHQVNGNHMPPSPWGHNQVEYRYDWMPNVWCKIVMVSRFAALSVSLTWQVSLLQTTSPRSTRPRTISTSST